MTSANTFRLNYGGAVEYESWLQCVLLGDCEDVDLVDQVQTNTYVTRMNREIDTIIRDHGKTVVGKAIWNVYGAGGDLSEALAPELGERRFELMESVKTLYAKGFAVHCTNWAPGGNQSPLHQACYMLWDMDGIECWAFRGDAAMTDASLDVLQFALHLESPACQESALHGLGHLASTMRPRIQPIIDRYLQTRNPIKSLREYAMDARKGCVM